MPTTEFSSRAISGAREKSQQALDAARERSRRMAGTAQRYIEENPVRAVSYTSALVFGVGLILGRLLAPSRYDADSAAAGELAQDWHGTVASRSQQWLDAAKSGSQEVAGTAQQRSREFLDAAQQRSRELLGTAEQRSRELLDTAQQRSRELLGSAQAYVQEHPARSASYAVALLGLGLLLSMMLSSGRDQGTDS